MKYLQRLTALSRPFVTRVVPGTRVGRNVSYERRHNLRRKQTSSRHIHQRSICVRHMHRSLPSLRLLVHATLVVLVAGLAICIPKPTSASSTIHVTTTNDEYNNGSGCSLREAIRAANTDSEVDGCPAGSGADTIILPAGTYQLTISGSGDDGGYSGDLDVWSDLTINGAGASETIVQACTSSPVDDSGAACIDRVLDIPFGGPSTVNLNDITIRWGRTWVGGGGGIHNRTADLNLNNTVIEGNQAYQGGGIYNHPKRTLTLVDSRVSSNLATNKNGGGIMNEGGTVSVVRSEISKNRAQGFSGSIPVSTGGGIYNCRASYDAGVVTLIDSTVEGNVASRRGGGIFNLDGSGWPTPNKVDLIRSTVSTNQALSSQPDDGGGGIYNLWES